MKVNSVPSEHGAQETETDSGFYFKIVGFGPDYKWFNAPFRHPSQFLGQNLKPHTPKTSPTTLPHNPTDLHQNIF